MAYFLGIFHGNCDLRNVGGVLEFRKLDFRGLKGQFDVKKANFRELTAKIVHYWPILATRNQLLLIFMEYVMRIVLQSMVERFQSSESYILVVSRPI